MYSGSPHTAAINGRKNDAYVLLIAESVCQITSINDQWSSIIAVFVEIIDKYRH